MNLNDLQKAIASKEQAITEARKTMLFAQEFIQRESLVLEGLKQAFKIMGQDKATDTPQSESKTELPPFRPLSLLHQVYELLEKAGKPLHVQEILERLELDPDKKISLTSSLSAYAQHGKVFKRFAPNTFGLLGWSLDRILKSKDLRAELLKTAIDLDQSLKKVMVNKQVMLNAEQLAKTLTERKNS